MPSHRGTIGFSLLSSRLALFHPKTGSPYETNHLCVEPVTSVSLLSCRGASYSEMKISQLAHPGLSCLRLCPSVSKRISTPAKMSINLFQLFPRPPPSPVIFSNSGTPPPFQETVQAPKRARLKKSSRCPRVCVCRRPSGILRLHAQRDTA